MKSLCLLLGLLALVWGSWLLRYDVQVIPVTVPELYSSSDRDWIIAADGTLFALNAQTGLAVCITNSAGDAFKPMIAIMPAMVWRWDRWSQSGALWRVAEVDAAGRVRLQPQHNELPDVER